MKARRAAFDTLWGSGVSNESTISVMAKAKTLSLRLSMRPLSRSAATEPGAGLPPWLAASVALGGGAIGTDLHPGLANGIRRAALHSAAPAACRHTPAPGLERTP